ncbi:hypothetical protein JHK85_051578 [Glycine max]|nr:hypothetical protein JHK85_051578 [Glycine max]
MPQSPKKEPRHALPKGAGIGPTRKLDKGFLKKNLDKGSFWQCVLGYAFLYASWFVPLKTIVEYVNAFIARKWDLVESLWTEMNAKGVAPVNCTYGTLIDAYSKRGLKEEALAWLQTMQSQGMEPDEVTMGIVVLLY